MSSSVIFGVVHGYHLIFGLFLAVIIKSSNFKSFSDTTLKVFNQIRTAFLNTTDDAGCMAATMMLYSEKGTLYYVGSSAPYEENHLPFCNGHNGGEIDTRTLTPISVQLILKENDLDTMPSIVKYNQMYYKYSRLNNRKTHRRWEKVWVSNTLYDNTKGSQLKSKIISFPYDIYMANIFFVPATGLFHGFFWAYDIKKGDFVNSYNDMYLVYATSTNPTNFGTNYTILFPNRNIMPVNGHVVKDGVIWVYFLDYTDAHVPSFVFVKKLSELYSELYKELHVGDDYHCFLSYPYEIVEKRFKLQYRGRSVITNSICCDSQTPCPKFRNNLFPVKYQKKGLLFNGHDANNHKICSSSVRNFGGTFDGVGLCPPVLQTYCTPAEMAESGKLGKSVCPENREVTIQETKRVFGDNELWFQMFEIDDLTAALKGCVIQPGKHCGLTAADCGVRIFSESSQLPQQCNKQCCPKSMTKDEQIKFTKTNKNGNWKQIVSTLMVSKPSTRKIDITFLGDSTADVYYWKMASQSDWQCSHGDDFARLPYDWITNSKLTKEHEICRFLPTAGWGVWPKGYHSRVSLRFCKSVINGVSVTIRIPWASSFLGNQTMEPTEWPYVWGVDQLGWMKETDEFRLKCIGLVLDVFGKMSDAVIFNAGHHYNHYRYRNKLTKHWVQLIKSFKTIQKDPLSRLNFVIALDTPPSNFPNAENTGLLNLTMKHVAKKFMTCIESSLSGKTIVEPSFKAPFVGKKSNKAYIQWFPCQHVDTTRGLANWRDDAMRDAIKIWKKNTGDDVPIAETTSYFSQLCGNHNGRAGDCLHITANTDYWNVMNSAFLKAFRMVV